VALSDDANDVSAYVGQPDPQPTQRPGRDAVALTKQAQQDVLRTDVVVAEFARLFLGEDNSLAGSVGEPFEHTAQYRNHVNAMVIVGYSATERVIDGD
jgi:hypothetical protein